MPFPTSGSAFPPDEYRPYYNKMIEWAAWYSGDPERLLRLYSSLLYFPDTDRGRFWARVEAEERSSCVHLPIAGDIASTSANLLFSEIPDLVYEETSRAGERITDFVKENGFFNVLVEGAEMAAALGGVFLKIDIEPGLIQLPIVSIVGPLQAIPYFWRNRLWEVLFFRTVKESPMKESCWRLFELRRREGDRLVIEYKLYKGSKDRVGREVDMDSIDETEGLGLEDTAYDGVEGLGCVYIPNMRPNRLFLGTPLGMGDYAGIISLMDSLDFAWTSWMRDVELGLAQLLIDEELLERPDGDILTQESAAHFDKFQKAFVKLNLAPWRVAGEHVKPIEQVQFDIRVEAHARTCEALLYQIVSQAGYSPHTFGLVESGSAGYTESGTALRIRERKSMLTREMKSRYWQPELRALLRQMQQMDIKSGLSPEYEVEEADVIVQDSIITDEREQSETLRNLDQAKAISTYTKVRMLHPEWEEEQIEEEVQRILDDQGAGAAPPFMEGMF